MTIMLIFVIAFPALATVLVKLVLSDLTSLKNSISALLTRSIETGDFMSNASSLFGISISQTIDTFMKDSAYAEQIKSYLSGMNEISDADKL